MKIALGSDHAGFMLKEQVKKYLQNLNYEVEDVGTTSTLSVDYPDYAKRVGLLIQNHQCDYGILICYTGIGMSIACNKIKGIRAALVNTKENAILTREHNDANVLCLGAKDTNIKQAQEIIQTFLSTAFTHGRHEIRVNKIMELENEKN